MSSNIETGHAKNVSNLSAYNQYLSNLGTSYNPTMAEISTAAFSAMFTTAVAKLQAVRIAEEIWKTETNKRENAFTELDTLSTRLTGALKSIKVPANTIDDLSALVTKIRGAKKTVKPVVDKALAPGDASVEPPVTRSSSQQSFDQKIDHFSKMVLLLQGVASYNPNEADLKLTALQASLTNMTALNMSAANALVNLRDARTDRNAFFYAPETGMLDLVKQSKAYIASLFGTKSQQYKNGFVFKFVRVVSKKNAQ